MMDARRNPTNLAREGGPLPGQQDHPLQIVTIAVKANLVEANPKAVQFLLHLGDHVVTRGSGPKTSLADARGSFN